MSEEKTITEDEYNTAPFLGIAESDEASELKAFIIDYTGNKLQPSDGKVNVHMIAETLASEFPEFVYAFAEENFIRGYEVGLEDAANLYTGKTEETTTEE